MLPDYKVKLKGDGADYNCAIIDHLGNECYKKSPVRFMLADYYYDVLKSEGHNLFFRALCDYHWAELDGELQEIQWELRNAYKF